MTVETFDFKIESLPKIKQSEFGSEWPVVYIINNDEEAYVGETIDARKRTGQHLENDTRKVLTMIHIIGDETFNKSVILDLESYLIKYMASDNRYRLQNSNKGIIQHNYYQKEQYEQTFSRIWERLRERGLADHSISDIENTDLFKYSPYKALSADQTQAMERILDDFYTDYTNGVESTVIVDGSAGTGKTILAIYMMKYLSELRVPVHEFDEEEEWFDNREKYEERFRNLKFAFVVPMQSLRATIRNVFKQLNGLTSDMVISPSEVIKETYDLLIVDESHRLRCRKALSSAQQYVDFDKNNERFGLGEDGTELDWIIRQSRNQILFYDSEQSVKPSDISALDFRTKTGARKCHRERLVSQLRCKGGEDYIDYVKGILYMHAEERMTFDDYDVRLFDVFDDMVDAIRKREEECGLSRLVAGYAWEWVTKKKSNKEKGLHDIRLGGYELDWNSRPVDWINSKESVNEVGCIHTVQGYDLNYAGVIFGHEIQFDKNQHRIVVDKKKYHDRVGKTALDSDEQLHTYILNIYVTLMTRGIRGTYLYVCDTALREYLKQYF